MRPTTLALLFVSLVACDRRGAGGSPDGGATPPGPGAASADAPGDAAQGATTSTEPPASDAGAPGEAETCGDATCKPGQRCISYYGIAGPSGPEFHSCEWPCAKGQACPEGTRCVTIADGPGQVCR